MSNLTYTGFTFQGRIAAEWYAKMLYGAPSLDRMKIMTNVKSKMQVPNLNVLEASKAANCNFTAGGEIVIGTRELEVTTIDINLEVCEEDLEVLFLSEDMRPGSNGTGDFTPAEVRNMILEQVTLRVSEEIEFMIWQGDILGPPGSYLSLIDGLEKKLGADIAVIPVVGVALTAANILTEVAKVKAAIPGPVLRRLTREGVGLGVNLTTYHLIIAGLTAITFNPGMVTAVPESIEYLGMRIFAFDGMSDDVMVFADWNRVWVGTDLLTDISDIKIIAMAETTGDSKIRIKGRYKLGVEYAVSEEIVFYS